MTEYYLGRAGSLQESIQEHTDDDGGEEETKGKVEAQEIPTWHYDGMEYPYFHVEMGSGTPCDLRNNKPRSSRLLFICLEDVVAEVSSSWLYERFVTRPMINFVSLQKCHFV